MGGDDDSSCRVRIRCTAVANMARVGYRVSVSGSVEPQLLQCPVCLEDADDILQLPHAFPVEGDISEHKLCGSCRARWTCGCPFCRQAPLPPPPKGYVGVFRPGDHVGSDSLDPGGATAPAASTSSTRSRSLISMTGLWLPRLRRLSGGLPRRMTHSRRHSSAMNPRTPCVGCHGGCMECDPDGFLYLVDDHGDWDRMEVM